MSPLLHSPLTKRRRPAASSVLFVSPDRVHVQGLAAGLMLCISMVDLLPAAVEVIGFAAASFWFYAGVAFFALVVTLIPEPSPESIVIDEDEEPVPLPPLPAAKAATTTASAVKTPATRARTRSASAVAASPNGGPSPAAAAQVAAEKTPARRGARAAAAAAASNRLAARDAKRRVLMSGLITAVGIALHNFPGALSRVCWAPLPPSAVRLVFVLVTSLDQCRRK